MGERPVTVGNATGRGFTGLHVDGELSGGIADVANWPPSSGGSEADGAGFRGGNWFDGSDMLPACYRLYAAYMESARFNNYGFRAVRLAP